MAPGKKNLSQYSVLAYRNQQSSIQETNAKMKPQYTKLSCALLLAGMLTACGGGGNIDIEETVKTINYSGRVTDETGTPIPGIGVTLENRVTDKFVTTTTEADGSFSIETNAGVYDILFDDPNAEKYISLQKTAIDLQNNKNTEIKIKSTDSSAGNQLTGSVTHLDGSPAVNQKLLLIPFAGHHSITATESENSETTVSPQQFAIPDLRVVSTDTQGKFSASLGEEGKAADIDFDLVTLSADAKEFDFTKLKRGYTFSSQEEKDAYYAEVRTYLRENAIEIIDIEKPQGPMHIDVQLGSDTQNLLNSVGLPSITSEATRQRRELEKRSNNKNHPLQDALLKIKDHSISSFLKIIPSAYAWEVIRPFDLYIQPERRLGIFVTLTDGSLINRSARNRFTFASLKSAKPATNLLSEQEKTKYGGDVATLISWDEFEFKNNNKGGKNDYILTLSQQQARECTFLFDGKGSDSFTIKSPLAEIYQPYGAIKTDMKFTLRAADSYLWRIHCLIPERE